MKIDLLSVFLGIAIYVLAVIIGYNAGQRSVLKETLQCQTERLQELQQRTILLKSYMGILNEYQELYNSLEGRP